MIEIDKAWALVKGEDQICYTLGASAREVWERVIADEVFGTGKTQEQLHKEGWRAKKVSVQLIDKHCPFKSGDVVIFEPKNFNPEYWGKLSEKDRHKYYSALGYGCDKPKLFVFLTEIHQAPGHCILVSLDDQTIETMRHTSDFRLATDEEL